MPQKSRKIKVGLIGSNKRALWYGAIFGNIEPRTFEALDPCAYHHMIRYGDVELRIRRATGFELVKVYDRDRKAADTIAGAFRKRPEVCSTLDEVSDDVDLVFIANESGDGGKHLKLAAPGLGKGVATFIDRPFASRVKDAKAMISLARRKRTPLLSCSALRMLPHVARFKARFAELEYVQRGMIEGQGPNPAHIADGIELTLALFGDEFRGRVHSVQSMGSWPLEVMLIQYGAPRAARTLPVLLVNSASQDHRHSFWVRAMSLANPIDTRALDAFVQSEGGLSVMNAIKRMLRTRKPPLPYEQMLESVAVAQAARKAHNRARPIAVNKIRTQR